MNTKEIKEENIDDTKIDNIFKELSWELDFWSEEVIEEKTTKKDKIYYLKLVSNILFYVNIVMFIFAIVFYSYIKIQNNPLNYSKTYIDPFCFLFLWDLENKNTWDYCSSVSALKKDFENKTNTLKQEIVDKLVKISTDLYAIENFVNTVEVNFLLSNNNNKLKIIDILNDFDRMKNDFTSKDKKIISCQNMKINNDNIVDVNCSIYSTSWERIDNNWNWIIWVSWDRSSMIEWTSISVAASFLNFIQKNSTYNFQLIQKPKTFISNIVIWEWPYVKKTDVSLKLKYNNFNNNLSL